MNYTKYNVCKLFLFFRENLPRHGIDVTFTDITDLNKLENAIQDNTKVFTFKTPLNL